MYVKGKGRDERGGRGVINVEGTGERRKGVEDSIYVMVESGINPL